MYFPVHLCTSVKEKSQPLKTTTQNHKIRYRALKLARRYISGKYVPRTLLSSKPAPGPARAYPATAGGPSQPRPAVPCPASYLAAELLGPAPALPVHGLRAPAAGEAQQLAAQGEASAGARTARSGAWVPLGTREHAEAGRHSRAAPGQAHKALAAQATYGQTLHLQDLVPGPQTSGVCAAPFCHLQDEAGARAAQPEAEVFGPALVGGRHGGAGRAAGEGERPKEDSWRPCPTCRRLLRDPGDAPDWANASLCLSVEDSFLRYCLGSWIQLCLKFTNFHLTKRLPSDRSSQIPTDFGRYLSFELYGSPF